MQKEMHLSIDLSFSHTDGKWRVPGSWVGRTYPDLKMLQEIVMIAERGCLDMIFWGDGTGIPSTYEGRLDAAVRWGVQWPRHDMSPIIAALSQVTERIGFTLTYSSTFMHPYYTARLLNSLDHVTGGRVALNLVGTTRLSDFGNYGVLMDDHDGRYERQIEFAQILRALWSSVEEDAIIVDRDTGEYADPAKVHAINHEGKYFQVKGPLNVIPSPQYHPVLLNAGASPAGIRAAAAFADYVFGSVEKRAEFDQALIDAGRDPDSVGTLAGIGIAIGETQAEAEHKRDLRASALPREAIGVYLSHNSGFDFGKLPEHFVLGEVAEEITRAQASQSTLVHTLAIQRGPEAEMSREELFDLAYERTSGSGHVITGTASQVADEMEEKFERMHGRGGFMIGGVTPVPGAILDVVNLLVPELQRRGRFRKRYETRTLREHFGLPPFRESAFARPAEMVSRRSESVPAPVS